MRIDENKNSVRDMIVLLLVIVVGAAIGLALAELLIPAGDAALRELVGSGAGALVAMVVWGRLSR